jgi:hypothetical protein
MNDSIAPCRMQHSVFERAKRAFMTDNDYGLAPIQWARCFWGEHV